MTSWRDLIGKELTQNGESWDDVDSNTLSESEMDTKFNDGWGGSEGKPFTLWTHRRVYFPVVYDGAEWVGSVSRNPDGVPTEHQGGQ